MRLETEERVTIFVKQNGSHSFRKVYDRDDKCMKAAIASFEIISKNSQRSSVFRCGNDPQIVLRLLDFTAEVKYAAEDGTEIDFEGDWEEDFVVCAATSVLQALHKGECIGKDVVSFQARRGEYLREDLELADLRAIILNQNIGSSFSLDFEKGSISRAYAYLKERELCLFLNETSNDTLRKMEEILTELFPRHIEA